MEETVVSRNMDEPLTASRHLSRHILGAAQGEHVRRIRDQLDDRERLSEELHFECKPVSGQVRDLASAPARGEHERPASARLGIWPRSSSASGHSGRFVSYACSRGPFLCRRPAHDTRSHRENQDGCSRYSCSDIPRAPTTGIELSNVDRAEGRSLSPGRLARYPMRVLIAARGSAGTVLRRV
jgi:hypothetical protein